MYNLCQQDKNRFAEKCIHVSIAQMQLFVSCKRANQFALKSAYAYHKITAQIILMQQPAEIKGNRQFLRPQKRFYNGHFTIWQLFISLSRKWR